MALFGFVLITADLMRPRIDDAFDYLQSAKLSLSDLCSCYWRVSIAAVDRAEIGFVILTNYSNLT